MLIETLSITPDQALALAPDPAAAKAGRELAQPRKWATLARDAQALWGECQGSAADPYQTRVDLGGPAFKCSCPSRKLPCKHALALLLLYAAQPQAFQAGAPPEWVSAWLAARTDRAARTTRAAGTNGAAQTERTTPTERGRKQTETRGGRATATAVADPLAQARRSDKRQARILAGLDELDLWLQDLARRGLAGLQTQPGGAWEALAARMVDAQAPGLARQLREIGALPLAGAAAGADWNERLAERLGRLYLIIAGYRRLEHLPPDTQADLRALVGWTVSQDELARAPGVRGEWLVLSQHVVREDRLRVQRTWLWSADAGGRDQIGRDADGRNRAARDAIGRDRTSWDVGSREAASRPPNGRDADGQAAGADDGGAPPAGGRAALLLDFAVGGQPFENSLLPGTRVPAELVFYPGAYPLRAALRQRQPAAAGAPWAGYAGFAAAAGAFAAALARYPWLERFPTPLQAVLPQRVGDQWWLRDADGQGWPLTPRFEAAWELLALSGGRPLPVFGEWDGHSLRPLSAWAEGRLALLGQDEA